MEQLVNEQAVVNILGKDTVMKFECMMDNVITYKTPYPKWIKDSLTFYELDVFLNDCDSFCDYEKVTDLTFKREVFRLVEINDKDEKQTIYYNPKQK